MVVTVGDIALWISNNLLNVFITSNACLNHTRILGEFLIWNLTIKGKIILNLYCDASSLLFYKLFYEQSRDS